MIINAKRKNGSKIVIEHIDMGLMQLLPEAGSPTPAGRMAYTSMYIFDGGEHVVSVPKDLADKSPNAAQLRFSEELAHLEAWGIDPETIELAPISSP